MYDNLTRTELEFAYREAEKRIAELEDERSDLDMIAKNYAIKIANLKKSCDETQELLDKQIEATYKLDKENAELKSENQKWKDEWQEQVQKANDEGYARTLQTIQLTKAKEILREYIRINLLPPIERNFDDEVKLFKQAEQFISEEYQKSNETKE